MQIPIKENLVTSSLNKDRFAVKKSGALPNYFFLILAIITSASLKFILQTYGKSGPRAKKMFRKIHYIND